MSKQNVFFYLRWSSTAARQRPVGYVFDKEVMKLEPDHSKTQNLTLFTFFNNLDKLNALQCEISRCPLSHVRLIYRMPFVLYLIFFDRGDLVTRTRLQLDATGNFDETIRTEKIIFDHIFEPIPAGKQFFENFFHDEGVFCIKFFLLDVH